MALIKTAVIHTYLMKHHVVMQLDWMSMDVDGYPFTFTYFLVKALIS